MQRAPGAGRSLHAVRTQLWGTMVQQPASYSCCIYCGDTEDKRTDEHIFPASFGGTEILLSASCTRCQKIINEEFEQTVLRKTFGNFRYKNKIRGRRFNKRPKKASYYYPIEGSLPKTKGTTLDINDFIEAEVDFDNYPSFLFLNVYRPATALLELLPGYGEPPPVEGTWTHLSQTNTNGYFEMELNDVAFGRELAKIAHCHAVKVLGLNSFVPVLRGIILGTNLSFMWHYIGTRDVPIAKPKTYEIEINTYSIQERTVFTVLITFACFIGAPRYEVVAGYR